MFWFYFSSYFDFDICEKEKNALFVIVKEEEKIYYLLIRTIVELSYKELVKFENYFKEKNCLYKFNRY